ncbi:MAG: glycosyltransferase [bacterium]|nr:glycosyltransferase [bacterium]
MRIAVAGLITKPITPHPLGGTEAFTYLLVSGLVKRGHEITLYCAKGSQTPAQNQVEICDPADAMGEESNVEFVYPYTLLEIRKLISDIQKGGFDILHVNFLKTFLLSYFADQISIPILHTIHRDFMSSPRLFGVYEKIGFHDNESFAFVSERARSMSLLKEQTYTIHNGIDIAWYPRSDRSDQKTFLWLSRIDPLKGPKEAAQAAKEAGVSLVLSGDIDRQKYQDYFDREIAPLLSETIVYEKPGDMAHKIALYSQAKAYIFPIQWEEPFGLVVVEALSCGTPVIAFNRGAMAEIIEDGVNGYLVPPEKGVIGIVEAIRRVNSLSSDAYGHMRTRCHEIAAEKFSSDRMVASYEGLYQQLVGSS